MSDCVDPRCPGWVEFGTHAALPTGSTLRLEFAGRDDGLMPRKERHEMDDVLQPVRDDINTRIKTLKDSLEDNDLMIARAQEAISWRREARLGMLSELHGYQLALSRLSRDVIPLVEDMSNPADRYEP